MPELFLKRTMTVTFLSPKLSGAYKNMQITSKMTKMTENDKHISHNVFITSLPPAVPPQGESEMSQQIQPPYHSKYFYILRN